ncbi:DUF805 domain-containing protein [Salinarimonas sp.]|uniref:DUF805 domain-containing protein n=1 Tax=Salinarimonas sp. TaxID=2766526 RepID=UPI00391A0FAD
MLQVIAGLGWIFALFMSFRGRISRVPYTLASICLLFMYFYMQELDQIISRHQIPPADMVLTFLALVIVQIWFNAALLIKRLHDVGLGASYLLFYVIPVIAGIVNVLTFQIPFLLEAASLPGGILAIALIFTRGQRHANAYGPPPNAPKTVSIA